MTTAGGIKARSDIKVASFDIFDTVVTRRVGEPRAAFLLLGRRLQEAGEIDTSPHAFSKARTNAEIRSFRNAGGLDSSVSLRDIYSELANALHWSLPVTEHIYERELEIENELLVAIPDGRRRVAEARERGEQVVFVSDMYLSASFLENMLRERDLFLDGDTLIVSNELQASKATGRLWPLVLEQLQVFPHHVHHVGNDKRSDGRTADKAGISSEVVDENNPNRYERALEAHADATDGLTSVLAGASRIARLDPPDPDRRALSDVAAGVVAPFVIGNLLWTLEVARKENLSALFFVARDGQVLCDVARALAKRVGYTGELTYVYGSRQAWSLGGLTRNHPQALNAVIPDSGDVNASLREVMARLEVSPEEIALPLSHAGFHRATWDRPIAAGQAMSLRHLLTDHPDVSRLVRDNSKKARDLALGYLDQVGAITDKPIGFVDLGTGATLFNSLGAMLESVGQAPPMGFYFGLRSQIPDMGFGKPLTYVRDEDERLGFLNTPGLLTLVELACTADHGSVLGYEDIKGTVIPLFDENGNEPVVDWGLPIIRQTVCRVAEEMLLDPDLVCAQGIDLRPAILDVFEEFWTSPTTDEAQTWGAYPFEDGWGKQSYRHPIAEARGVVDAFRRQPYRHWWEQGANQLSGPVTRTAFQSRRVAKDLAGLVRRRLP